MLIILNLTLHFIIMNDVDHDILERFQKALSHCRTCDHVRMAHKFLGNKGFCMEAKLQNTGTYISCKCKMYIPSDNLEFLEYVAQCKKVKK